MSNETEEKIREMAKLSILSNRISEVHEKNLKLYPFIFFDTVKSVKIEYDFDSLKRPSIEDKTPANQTGGSVTYHIELETFGNQKQKRLEGLAQAVKSLFWKSTHVIVYFNGELAYESPYDR